MVPSRFARYFDALLLWLVGMYAFFVGTYSARNSDLWLHLATGRAIADGKYDFVTDPFSFSTDGLRWVNHAWLTDWLSFLVAKFLNIGDLIWFKAVTVCLAVTVVVAWRRREYWWSGVIAVAVGIAAISPRATLQPMLLSVMLLPLLLRLLQAGGRSYIAVPMLIALWANLDEWFVLGPVLAIFHFAGCRYRKSRDVPLWLPIASIAACLLTPYHIFGFTLPIELSPAFWGSEFARDPRIVGQFGSYFSGNPQSGGYLDSVAFWSFIAIAIGTVALLWVRRKSVELWEVVSWGLVAILAIWQARLVPFAVIASLALFLPHLLILAERIRKPRAIWLLRIAALAVVLQLAALTWTGWLNGARGRDRSLGMIVTLDPLWSAAEKIQAWRREGQLSPDLRILATNPDHANQLAWLLPNDRGDLDTRWDFHARSSEAGRLTIAERLGLGSDPASEIDLGYLDRHRIGLVLLADPSPSTLLSFFDPKSFWRPVFFIESGVLLARKSADGATMPSIDPSIYVPTKDPIRDALATSQLPREPLWWEGVTGARSHSVGNARVTTHPALWIASRNDSLAMQFNMIRGFRERTMREPHLPKTWYDLARAYSSATIAEGKVTSKSGLFAELRRVQRITALQQSVISQPEFEAGQSSLAAVLSEVGYVDRSLAVRRKELALVRRRGDTERAAAIAEEVTRLENLAFDRECLYQVQTQKMAGNPLGRARTAIGLGLVDLAIDVLLKSSSDLYGADGIRLLAGLLIASGQAREAIELLDRPEFKHGADRLGYHEAVSESADGRRVFYRLPAYEWYRFLIAASVLESDPAPHLWSMRRDLTRGIDGIAPLVEKTIGELGVNLAEEIGFGGANAMLLRRVILDEQELRVQPIMNSRILFSARADLCVLEAAWYLEAGLPDPAMRSIRQAFDDYEVTNSIGIGPAKPLAQKYLDAIKAK